jgi:superfamily II DNA or RNA helicase
MSSRRSSLVSRVILPCDDVLADDLAELLEHHPGLTADQLVSALERARPVYAVPWSARAVTLALYDGSDRFRRDTARPSRWWLRCDGAGSGVASLVPGGGDEVAAFAGPSLYAWQRDALDAWAGAGHRGVVEAVTGSGKTMLGLVAALDELRRRGHVVVVVPTVELMHQWRRRIVAVIPSGFSVGCLGDGAVATLREDDVVVGVVNSLRTGDLRPTRQGGLLVADECHRYGSSHNRLALDERFERRLGLSATYAREDDGHLEWLDPYFGGTCFRLDYRRAVDDEVTARFKVSLIAVRFAEDEQGLYDELTDEIRRRYARLMGRFDLPAAPFAAFLRAVQALASGRSERSEGASDARLYLAALMQRRRLLADTAAKTDMLASLAPILATASRSIVFTRSIATAELASNVLAARGLRASVLHSGMSAGDRRAVLNGFAAGEIESLSAPRVLDEGIDVPEADIAVILGASATRRQMIQRMGRVLRKKSDGRRARFVVLFVEDTIEDPAHGAHESFLDEITDVADEVRRFGSSELRAVEAIAGFLTI